MKLKALLPSFLLLTLFTFSALASAQTSSDTKAIRKELAELRHEVALLKQENKNSSQFTRSKKQKKITTQTVNNPNTSYIPFSARGNSNMDLLIQSYLQSLPLDWDNPGLSFVSIGPYINVPIQFNGN